MADTELVKTLLGLKDDKAPDLFSQLSTAVQVDPNDSFFLQACHQRDTMDDTELDQLAAEILQDMNSNLELITNDSTDKFISELAAEYYRDMEQIEGISPPFITRETSFYPPLPKNTRDGDKHNISSIYSMEGHLTKPRLSIPDLRQRDGIKRKVSVIPDFSSKKTTHFSSNSMPKISHSNCKHKMTASWPLSYDVYVAVIMKM